VLLIRPSLCAIIVPRVDSPVGYRFWTRQNAAAFNQPLSFDTSSVISMSYMFNVRFRFRLRLLPTLSSWATPRALLIRPSLCAIVVPRVNHPYRMPPLDSAGSGRFQPAAELRHRQRHQHELDVLCALPPAPSAPMI